ncbi:hypothetical protein [Eisenbergiella porci]|uniref:hypothetical protein n=1 Tax=Eisenbergiella porci TaxID=2652274 RepID=UPI0022E739BF|nr:hypothetical protein [Eisenbergiella porci]
MGELTGRLKCAGALAEQIKGEIQKLYWTVEDGGQKREEGIYEKSKRNSFQLRSRRDRARDVGWRPGYERERSALYTMKIGDTTPMELYGY